MSQLSTHILDTSLGRPAAGVLVRLEHQTEDGWHLLQAAYTDDDGRIKTLSDTPLHPGRYRLTADIGSWFTQSQRETLYPCAQIDFVIARSGEHFHLPFLISPWSWSTYRGS